MDMNVNVRDFLNDSTPTRPISFKHWDTKQNVSSSLLIEPLSFFHPVAFGTNFQMKITFLNSHCVRFSNLYFISCCFHTAVTCVSTEISSSSDVSAAMLVHFISRHTFRVKPSFTEVPQSLGQAGIRDGQRAYLCRAERQAWSPMRCWSVVFHF